MTPIPATSSANSPGTTSPSSLKLVADNSSIAPTPAVPRLTPGARASATWRLSIAGSPHGYTLLDEASSEDARERPETTSPRAMSPRGTSPAHPTRISSPSPSAPRSHNSDARAAERRSEKAYPPKKAAGAAVEMDMHKSWKVCLLKLALDGEEIMVMEKLLDALAREGLSVTLWDQKNPHESVADFPRVLKGSEFKRFNAVLRQMTDRADRLIAAGISPSFLGFLQAVGDTQQPPHGTKKSGGIRRRSMEFFFPSKSAADPAEEENAKTPRSDSKTDKKSDGNSRRSFSALFLDRSDTPSSAPGEQDRNVAPDDAPQGESAMATSPRPRVRPRLSAATTTAMTATTATTTTLTSSRPSEADALPPSRDTLTASTTPREHKPKTAKTTLSRREPTRSSALSPRRDSAAHRRDDRESLLGQSIVEDPLPRSSSPIAQLRQNAHDVTLVSPESALRAAARETGVL